VADVSAALSDVRTLNALEKELDILIAYLFAFDGGRSGPGPSVGAGVPEDPATGSGAGPLGVYLALHGALPGGAARFFIDQGSRWAVRPSSR